MARTAPARPASALLERVALHLSRLRRDEMPRRRARLRALRTPEQTKPRQGAFFQGKRAGKEFFYTLVRLQVNTTAFRPKGLSCVIIYFHFWPRLMSGVGP